MIAAARSAPPTGRSHAKPPPANARSVASSCRRRARPAPALSSPGRLDCAADRGFGRAAQRLEELLLEALGVDRPPDEVALQQVAARAHEPACRRTTSAGCGGTPSMPISRGLSKRNAAIGGRRDHRELREGRGDAQNIDAG